MRCTLVLAFSLLLAACGTRYAQMPVQVAQDRLEPDRTVLISIPADGSYDGRPAARSGLMTAAAVRAAFLQRATDVELIEGCARSDCIEAGRSRGHGYYVEPEVLHWEDRATEWSAIPDRLEVRLAVFDVATGMLLGSQVIAGTSSLWTFGGDHPQDLLREPVGAYVGTLYE